MCKRMPLVSHLLCCAEKVSFMGPRVISLFIFKSFFYYACQRTCELIQRVKITNLFLHAMLQLFQYNHSKLF